MTRRAAKCAVCGKPVLAAYAPFCSQRCKDVDLHRWLTGGYVIPGRGEETPERDQAPADAPGDTGDERN